MIQQGGLLLEELKGDSRTVMTFVTPRSRFDLLCFADESWAIRRDGRVIGVWEPGERGLCIEAFGHLAAIRQHAPAVVLLVPEGALQSPPSNLN